MILKYTPPPLKKRRIGKAKNLINAAAFNRVNTVACLFFYRLTQTNANITTKNAVKENMITDHKGSPTDSLMNIFIATFSCAL